MPPLAPSAASAADAIAQVFETHARYIEAVARQHAPTLDDVPDIVQDVGLQLCRSLHRFRGQSDIRTWLYRVTVNAAVTVWRQQQRRGRLEAKHLRLRPTAPDSLHPGSPELALMTREQRAAIEGALAVLSVEQGGVIRNDFADAAITPSSARTRKLRHTARRAMRQRLATDPRATL